VQFDTSGDAVPRPLGFVALGQRQVKRGRRRGRLTTSPLPLDRRGARVASQQRPILRDGVVSVSWMEDGPQWLSRRFGVEDLDGAPKGETLAGPAVESVDIGSQLGRGELGQVGALGQVLA
jgi:hypothetical protein